jgi:hypothetical protein
MKKSSITTELVAVTPAVAAEWLKSNSDNRPIRRSHVAALRRAFAQPDGYVQTHQGIAFDADGVLIDGQHRLTAIAELEKGRTFTMLVTRGLARKETMHVVDSQQAKRSLADSLRIERPLAEVAAALARIDGGITRDLRPLDYMPYVRLIEPQMSQLLNHCGSQVATWSSASVRAAACLRMKQGYDQYVLAVYAALVHLDFGSMPPIAEALVRSSLTGKIKATERLDLFARSWFVFDPARKNLSKIQIKDPLITVGEARRYIASVLA